MLKALSFPQAQTFGPVSTLRDAWPIKLEKRWYDWDLRGLKVVQGCCILGHKQFEG